MEWWLLLAGFAAGFIDSIIGGGGVISLPALLATGMPPHVAVATNKVVGTGASTIATINYGRAGLLNLRLLVVLMPLATGASAFGAAMVLRLDGELILWAVLFVMIILSFYVLMQPKFGQVDRINLTKQAILGLAFAAIAIGYYDGMLGPGTGNLLLFALVAIAGMPFLPAAAHGRAINFASNVGALAFFATTGLIDWTTGLLMAIGTVSGSFVGSHSNIRSQAKWVRPLFVVLTGALFIRLL